MKVKKQFSILAFMFFDALVIALSYIISIFLAKTIGYNGGFPYIAIALIIIIIFKIIMHYIFGLYNVMVRFFDFYDVLKTSLVTIITNLIIIITLFIPNVPQFLPKSMYLFITLLEIVGFISYRYFGRAADYFKRISKMTNPEAKRTIIIGAGSAGELALKEISRNKNLNNNVICFLDDDIKKIGKTISNVKVMGPISEIKNVIEKYNIEEIVMGINNFPKVKYNNLINLVSEYDNIAIKKIELSKDIKKDQRLKIIDIKVEDLLDRYEAKLENEEIKNFIKDETVLVTGAGGSIGSELCRQIFSFNPKKLIIFDIYENNAYEIQMELERLKFKNPNIKVELVVLIGSVYNKKRLEEVFKNHKPSLVFHAAAYKHVPLMEDSPVEAIRTNVLGTKNAAELSNKYNVKKFVLVSSDKAVRPTNIMGATKRYAELIVSHYNNIGPTKFSSVRFGNVLGSNGSVIPLFKKQIADGGPVTVTHKDITRYFMTIPEAVGLILQSAIYADGGEIFVLDMGEPIKIYDLAKKMIRLSGLRPYIDIDIDVVGLRPGEKLYEELLVDHNNESHLKTQHNRIFIEKQNGIKYDDLDFEYVINNYEDLSNEQLKVMISKVIKSYNHRGE